MDENPKSANLSQLAIDAALNCRWEEALRLNKKIIKADSQNTDALSRLARVYMEMGRLPLARKYYSSVIKIDPYNPIALKNLRIIKTIKSNGQVREVHPASQSKLSATLFLQEPGKTKIVTLLKVAEPQKLSQVYCGMPVEMVSKNRKITIADRFGNYLGAMPDDISHHLLRLLAGGNKYELFIKSIRVNGLAVLIKETFRSKKFKNQPSFLEHSNQTLTSTEIFTSLDSQHESEVLEETEQDSAV